jgi:hypothetical protein
MNNNTTYVVVINIQGKSGARYGLPLEIVAINQVDAVKKATQQLTEDGFVCVGLNHVEAVHSDDWSDEHNWSDDLTEQL